MVYYTQAGRETTAVRLRGKRVKKIHNYNDGYVSNNHSLQCRRLVRERKLAS